MVNNSGSVAFRPHGLIEVLVYILNGAVWSSGRQTKASGNLDGRSLNWMVA